MTPLHAAITRVLTERPPLRKIVREFINEHGAEKEELECGHVVPRKQDIYGATNAYRRRCKQCLNRVKQEISQ